VLETRESEASIRRRRECKACRLRYTTYERPQFSRLVVRAPNGSQRNYTKRWLANALLAAAGNLPEDVARALPADVEAQLRATSRRVFSTEDVGAVAARELGRQLAAHAALEARDADGGTASPAAEQIALALDATMPSRRPAPAQLPLPIDR
jgi:transcriptional regulator NrdR family protein